MIPIMHIVDLSNLAPNSQPNEREVMLNDTVTVVKIEVRCFFFD